MRIWLNDRPIDLLTGMTVRQALIRADLLTLVSKGATVYDEWGHEMGLNGALLDGMRIRIKGPDKDK